MTILNTVEVSEGKGATFTLFLWAFVAALCAIVLFHNRKWTGGLIISVLAILLAVFAIGNLASFPRIRYEVSFDENYPVSELIENYEIVGRRGDLLILEDKK